jgi:hypothetical protein
MVFFWKDKSAGEVSFKIYEYNGTPVTEKIKANVSLKHSNSIDFASIRAAVSSTGDFLITWQVVDASISDWDIRGRLFDSDGKPLTDDFHVSGLEGKFQSNPSVGVCTMTNDNFVVVYDNKNQFGVFDVYFKI